MAAVGAFVSKCHLVWSLKALDRSAVDLTFPVAALDSFDCSSMTSSPLNRRCLWCCVTHCCLGGDHCCSICPSCSCCGTCCSRSFADVVAAVAVTTDAAADDSSMAYCHCCSRTATVFDTCHTYRTYRTCRMALTRTACRTFHTFWN